MCHICKSQVTTSARKARETSAWCGVEVGSEQNYLLPSLLVQRMSIVSFTSSLLSQAVDKEHREQPLRDHRGNAKGTGIFLEVKIPSVLDVL